MKRKVFLAAFVTLFSSTFLFAQLKQVSGKVTDESGLGLDHASVVLKEKGTGVKSDSLGNFTIKIPDDGKSHVVLISYSGYEEQKVNLTSTSDNIKVKLKLAKAKEEGDVVILNPSYELLV